jgi:hypothetical protein
MALTASVTVASIACAQKPPASNSQAPVSITRDSVKAAGEFAQQFFDWYTSTASADEKVPPEWKVLTANRYLDAELAAWIRADSAARANVSPTRELLDFDPFLGGQDRCKLPPRVVGVHRVGPTFVISTLTCVQSASQTNGPRVEVEVRPLGGTWKITNVSFGRDLDLKSYLCRLGKTDTNPANRPTHC